MCCSDSRSNAVTGELSDLRSTANAGLRKPDMIRSEGACAARWARSRMRSSRTAGVDSRFILQSMPAIDIRTALFAGLLIAAGTDGWDRWTHRPRHPPMGQIAESEPLQAEISPAAPSVARGRWTLIPRASYDITARILSTERYRFDRLAALVPEDLALGWGPMSDSQVLATLDISQSGRFYWWRPHADTPVPPETIVTHSANTHVIPADEQIARTLAASACWRSRAPHRNPGRWHSRRRCVDTHISQPE